MGQPCLLSLRINLLHITMLKAPSISKVSREATSPLARAASMSWTKQATRSDAARLGGAPKYYSGSFLYPMAGRGTLQERSLSSPFLMHDHNEIGLQPLCVVYAFSGLPALGIMSYSEAPPEEVRDVASYCRQGGLGKCDRDPICHGGGVAGPYGGLPGFLLRYFRVPLDILVWSSLP